MAPRENKDPNSKNQNPLCHGDPGGNIVIPPKKVNQDLTNMSPTYLPDNYKTTPTNDIHVLRTSYFSTASYSTSSVTAASHPPVKLAGMSSKP